MEEVGQRAERLRVAKEFYNYPRRKEIPQEVAEDFNKKCETLSTAGGLLGTGGRLMPENVLSHISQIRQNDLKGLISELFPNGMDDPSIDHASYDWIILILKAHLSSLNQVNE